MTIKITAKKKMLRLAIMTTVHQCMKDTVGSFTWIIVSSLNSITDSLYVLYLVLLTLNATSHLVNYS